MSDAEAEVGREAREAEAPVRLRRPERRQMAMVVQCPDDWVGPTHPVRMVMAVVEKLDLSRFCEPIKARDGVAGRDACAPQKVSTHKKNVQLSRALVTAGAATSMCAAAFLEFCAVAAGTRLVASDLGRGATNGRIRVFARH